MSLCSMVVSFLNVPTKFGLVQRLTMGQSALHLVASLLFSLMGSGWLMSAVGQQLSVASSPLFTLVVAEAAYDTINNVKCTGFFFMDQ